MICTFWMWIKIMKMIHLKSITLVKCILYNSAEENRIKNKNVEQMESKREKWRCGSDGVTELHPPQAKTKYEIIAGFNRARYARCLSQVAEDLTKSVTFVWIIWKIHSIPLGFNLNDFVYCSELLHSLDYNLHNASQSSFFVLAFVSLDSVFLFVCDFGLWFGYSLHAVNTLPLQTEVSVFACVCMCVLALFGSGEEKGNSTSTKRNKPNTTISILYYSKNSRELAN